MYTDSRQSTSFFFSLAKYISQTASVVAVAAGCFVLIGWAFDITLLKSILPQWVTMKANTAIAFVLAGISLRLSLEINLNALLQLIKNICALLVTLIGLITLSQDVFQWNSGIDQLFFTENIYAVATSSPGRMAPSTAFSFMFVGLSLLVRKRWSVFLIHAVFAVSMLSFIGYLYGVHSLYGIEAYTKMAFHTSLLFLVLALGLLFSHPESMLVEIFTHNSVGGILIRRLLPAAIIVMIFLGWLRLVGQRSGLYNVEFGVALYTFLSLLIFTILFWRSGRLLHTLDIERTQAEHERQNLLNELEFRVQKRTEELTNSTTQLNAQIEERIRAESRYKTTLDHMMEGCQIISFDYTYLYINDAGAIQGHIPKEQLLGKTMMEMYPGIEQSPFFLYLKKCLEERIPYRMENEFVYSDGTRGWFDLSIEPVPEGAFILSIDITERKYAVESLQELVSTAQKLSLARTLDEVMRIVRATARKLTHADGATFILRDGDLCHYADEDAIGPLWKGQRFPMSACISGWAMLHRAPAIIEDIYVDPRIPIDAYRPTFVKSLLMVPIRSMDPIGAIGNYWAHQHKATPMEQNLLQTLADITSVTIENINVYSELEQRVKERTAQLESVNKELEAFSYSVSHDLRAPLRHVNGFVDLLIKHAHQQLDDKSKRYMETISSSAKEMGTLIDELLVFSRMGRVEMKHTIVDMNQLVADAVHMWKNDSNGRIIEWNIGNFPSVEADPSMLRLVFQNLIDNAVKYTRKQEHTVIEISSTENEKYIEVQVRDNGVGFDMQYKDKLFGVFQRLHHVQEFEGTGIGLANVRRIIQRHGGTVWATSEVNNGAAFYFTLPKMQKG